MKALLINSETRTVAVTDYTDYRDLQRAVGGPIALGAMFANGDALFVDDEGLGKPQAHFFRVAGYQQPLAGNGIVTGPDFYHPGEDPEEGSEDVQMTPSELLAKVEFMHRGQFDSWGKANASEPAHTFTTVRADGQTVTTVLGYYGDLVARVPRPPEQDQE